MDELQPDPPSPSCVHMLRTIVDPSFIDLESATRSMAEQTGYRIETHRLDFFGICLACQRDAGTASQRCPR